jgi:hypothetical protein
MKRSILLGTCLALSLGGCAEMQSTPAPAKAPMAAASNPMLDETIANAEKEIAAAKKADGLWLHTEKFLADAKTLKSEGKADEALKMAKKALKEAQLGIKQAQAEAGAKPHYE